MVRMNAAERRAALIDATVRIIVREGLASTSTRAIAAEAGMPLSSLHYVFESREQLVGLAVREIVAETGLRVDLEDIDYSSLGSAVRSSMGQILEFVTENELATLALHECLTFAARSEGLREVGRARRAEDERLTRSVLETAADRLGLRWLVPVEHLASTAVTMVEGLTFAWLNTRDSAAAWLGVDALAALLASTSEALPVDAAPGRETDHAASVS